MAKKAPSHLRVTTVEPIYKDGVVTCECGFPMTIVNYTAFPSGDRWQFWRCTVYENHITAALPLAVRE